MALSIFEMCHRLHDAIFCFGSFITAEQAEHGRLARSRWADDYDDLALGDPQVDPAQDLDAPAFADVLGGKHIQHFMTEVNDPQDVGVAWDRVVRRGLAPVVLTLGVHPNDEMFSFYVRTPSGFDMGPQSCPSTIRFTVMAPVD